MVTQIPHCFPPIPGSSLKLGNKRQKINTNSSNRNVLPSSGAEEGPKVCSLSLRPFKHVCQRKIGVEGSHVTFAPSFVLFQRMR